MRYAISDIHGCLKSLKALLDHVLNVDPHKDELFFLGDYIDRGPDSKGVLDYMIGLKEQGYQICLIKGNHDQMLVDAVEGRNNHWSTSDGLKSMISFGVNHPRDIPEIYFTLIKEMELYMELKDFFLVHAGFDFSLDDPFEDADSMMNIREIAVDNAIVHHKKIIHGHTPVQYDQIIDAVNSSSQTINIDNGCVLGSSSGYGSLVALELDSLNLYAQPFID